MTIVKHIAENVQTTGNIIDSLNCIISGTIFGESATFSNNIVSNYDTKVGEGLSSATLSKFAISSGVLAGTETPIVDSLSDLYIDPGEGVVHIGQGDIGLGVSARIFLVSDPNSIFGADVSFGMANQDISITGDVSLLLDEDNWGAGDIGKVYYESDIGHKFNNIIETSDNIISSGTIFGNASGLSNIPTPITTTGDMIYGDGSAIPTRLSLGTLGYILYAGSTAPEWTNAYAFKYIGSGNYVAGSGAGVALDTAEGNIALGTSALAAVNDENYNVAIGNTALTNLTGGEKNLAIGYGASAVPASMSSSIAIGYHAMYGSGPASSWGNYNIAIGDSAMVAFRESSNANIAIGVNALGNLTTSSNYNTAMGYGAGLGITTGASYNTMFGMSAGISLTTGDTNTCIGGYAGGTGDASGNIFLGHYAGYYETGSNSLFIDNQDRTDEATARLLSLVYGTFDALPENQTVTMNANVTISGTMTVGQLRCSGTIFGDGSGISNIPNSTLPGGSDTQIQFNDGGSFGGDSGLTYNKTTGNIICSGTYFGDGTGLNIQAAGIDTQVQFNNSGAFGANSGLSFDSDTNLTVNDIVNVTLDEDSLRGGLKIKHSKSSVGSSEYYFVQDSYDILQIKRSGDTTGDGNYFSIVDIISPSIALDDVDSEATIALTTRRGTPTTVTRTLDIYNDEYARDNGMGFRQLYKNTTPNPIRFEFHNKTTGNGKFTLNDCYAYVGNFHLDYVTADVTGVIPEVDDWIWDNAATILPDDTKIISIETGVPNPAATRLHLNKAVLVEGEAVSFRGVNVKEIMRLTPARQLLVRKFLASTSGTVAEFGGSMVADGNIITSGTYFGNGSGLSNVVFPNAVQTLTNKTLPAISGSQTVIAGDLSVLGTIYGNVSASASDHNTLANLQGGSSTERYHLTQTEHDTIVLTDSTQTLTNKTIGDNLVVSGTTYAQKIYSAGGGVSGDLLVSGTLTANRIIGGLGSRLGSSDVYLQLNDFPLAGGSIPLLTGFNNTPQGPGSPPPTLWGIEGLFGVIETSGEPDTYTGMYFSNHNASKIVLLGYFPDSNLILMGDLLGGTEIIVSSAIFASTTTTNPPFGVASSILVSDLNSDLWDGYQFSDYLDQPVLTTSNITLGSGTFTGNVVCSGTYFGDASGLSNLPSSGTTDHAALSNLNWVSAGHTFDTNLDVGSNNIVTSGTIFGEGTGLRNIITGDDIEISDNSNGVILKSPSGIRWRLTVNDSGIVSATSL